MIGTITSPATGSAHHHPATALKSNPPKRIADGTCRSPSAGNPLAWLRSRSINVAAWSAADFRSAASSDWRLAAVFTANRLHTDHQAIEHIAASRSCHCWIVGDGADGFKSRRKVPVQFYRYEMEYTEVVACSSIVSTAATTAFGRKGLASKVHGCAAMPQPSQWRSSKPDIRRQRVSG